uniref:Heme haloperoxidase family profile domain-containing protein n=1 Tax=Mycena chlorophos TaxID=658473 RepID=A0ABQ0L2P0_MYCCL|nr:predicted protein [Mycena chlorophos]
MHTEVSTLSELAPNQHENDGDSPLAPTSRMRGCSQSREECFQAGEILLTRWGGCPSDSGLRTGHGERLGCQAREKRRERMNAQLLMKLSFSVALSFFSAVQFAPSVVGFPSANDHTWIAPGPDDQRSPCPGLNTLANHGYLPHNGQNFTIKDVLDAAQEAFNVHWDAILVAAKFGLLTRNDLGSEENMSLGPLLIHALIEHDASISRQDVGDGTGDALHFNETLFSVLANSNPGVDYYNATSAGAVQYARLQDSKENNPYLLNTQREFVLRTRESGLYLSIFGDPLTGVAPKEFVNIFFREERLPIEEGWSKPTTLINSTTLMPIEKVIKRAANWTATSVCEPVVLTPGAVVNQGNATIPGIGGTHDGHAEPLEPRTGAPTAKRSTNPASLCLRPGQSTVRRDFLQPQTPCRKAPLFPQPDVLAQGCTRCRSRLRRRQRTSSPTAFSLGLSLCAILYTSAGAQRAGRRSTQPRRSRQSPEPQYRPPARLCERRLARGERITSAARRTRHAQCGLDLLYLSARGHERGRAPKERVAAVPYGLAELESTAPPMITRVELGATVTSTKMRLRRGRCGCGTAVFVPLSACITTFPFLPSVPRQTTANLRTSVVCPGQTARQTRRRAAFMHPSTTLISDGNDSASSVSFRDASKGLSRNTGERSRRPRMSPPLPDEILSEILSPALKVKDEAFTKSCVGQTDFVRYSEPTSAYLLVCKSWLRVATPLLYHVVVVCSKAQAKALSMALTQSPILGTFIRRLRIEGGYGAAMKTILASSPNISDLFLYLDLYASDSVDGLCKGLVHVNPTNLILDDHDDRTNSSTTKLAAAVAKMCAASDRLTALQLSTGSTPRLDSIVQSLVERKQLTTLFFSTPSTAVEWYDILKDCPLQTISIADIFGILSNRRLNNLKAAIGERKIQLNYTPPSPRQTFGVKAGPAVDIGPSLNPHFVPMAGAPQAIQDRVWSLVIDFAFEAQAVYVRSPPHHIARVNKMFARLIIRRAYTDVVIRNRGAASQLARTLRSQPTYGRHIRDDNDSIYDEDMSTILANAPNLEYFISSNCDLRGDQYWMSSHIGDLAITWSHVVLAGQTAGTKLKTLCVEVAPRQQANVGGSETPHTAADVFSTFTELKSLTWRSSESVEFLLDSDAGAGSARAALPHLEDLTVPGAPKAFFELLAAMELPSLRKIMLPTLTSCYTLLSAHGSQLTELSIGTASLLQLNPEAPNSNSKSQSSVAPVLELCPNLVKLTVLCKMPWVTSFVPMPRCELFDARTPASSLLTVTFLLPYNAGTKNNAELWENFFRGFGTRITGCMPSLRTVHFAAPVIWPTTERDIAKSFWVRIAEMLMATAAGVQVADKNGNKWRPWLSVSGRGGGSSTDAGTVGTGDRTAVRRSTRKRAAALAGED